jgi:hypothetical protein
MKVWLDDVREEPGGWTRARTAREAIALLKIGEVEEISLDYNLGECEQSGVAVLNWMLEQVATGWQPPRRILVHSEHPYGAEEMRQLAQRISRYHKEWIS